MFADAGFDDIQISPIVLGGGEKIAETLASLTNKELKSQFLAYQYIVRAKKRVGIGV
jgi:hypothetical protein